MSSKLTYTEIAENAHAKHRPICIRLSRVHARDGEYFSLTITDESNYVQVVRAQLSAQDIGDLITGSAVSGEAEFYADNIGKVRQTQDVIMPIPEFLEGWVGNSILRNPLLTYRRDYVTEHFPGWTADEHEPTGRSKIIPSDETYPNAALRVPIFRWVEEPQDQTARVRDRIKETKSHTG